jgi:hypothetical protein
VILGVRDGGGKKEGTPCDHTTSYIKKVYENGEISFKYCGKCGEILKKGKKHFKFE